MAIVRRLSTQGSSARPRSGDPSSARHSSRFQPRTRAAWALVALTVVLLIIDLLILLGGVAHRLNETRGIFPAFADSLWNIDWDRGYAESFGYIQMGLAAVVLVILGLRIRRASVLFVVAAAFIVIIGDDALEWHENAGGWLRVTAGLQDISIIRSQDVGEVLAWAAMALPLLVAGVIAFLLSSQEARRVVGALCWPLIALVFFAAVWDLAGPASANFDLSTRSRYLINLIEGAGELVSMTAVLVVALACLIKIPRRQPKH